MYVGIKLFPVLRVPEPVRDKGQCAAHEALYARSTPRHGNTKPLADLLQRQIYGVIGLCFVSHLCSHMLAITLLAHTHVSPSFVSSSSHCGLVLFPRG